MEAPADQNRRLQRCINDLISVLALPALWAGSEPSHMVGTLLDVLLAMLRLDLAYARLSDWSGGPPIEMVRSPHRQHPSVQPEQVGQALGRWSTGDESASRFVVPNPAGEGEVSIASFSLGLQDEVGVLVAGSRRSDFPTDIERLLLRVATNQAGIGLQEARRSGEQKRVAEALEQQVAERTRQLTAVNEELRQTGTELRQLIDVIPQQVVVFDPNWSPLFANRRELEYTGLTLQEVQSTDEFAKTFHPDDLKKLEVIRERGRSEGAPFEMEARIRGSDGHYRWFLIRDNPLRDQQGRVLRWYGTRTDIEDRKRAEETVHQAQADLAHVNRVTTMGELTASLAHEVKQPIAAALTDADACVRWLARDPPAIDKAHAAALRIVEDGTRAADIVSRIRLLFTKGTPEHASIDVNDVIRDLIVLLRSEATRYAISVRTELAADLPPVMGDRVQLQQVMMNLIMNSIDAMKAVEGTRELAITSQRAEDGQLLVSVSDTGVGLPPQQEDQIFKAFFTTKPQGIGMGLSISRSIVESHDGRLWAADNAPRGARFCVILPTIVAAHAGTSGVPTVFVSDNATGGHVQSMALPTNRVSTRIP
jgi:PAS domain S-box-containing protein